MVSFSIFEENNKNVSALADYAKAISSGDCKVFNEEMIQVLRQGGKECLRLLGVALQNTQLALNSFREFNGAFGKDFSSHITALEELEETLGEHRKGIEEALQVRASKAYALPVIVKEDAAAEDIKPDERTYLLARRPLR